VAGWLHPRLRIIWHFLRFAVTPPLKPVIRWANAVLGVSVGGLITFIVLSMRHHQGRDVLDLLLVAVLLLLLTGGYRLQRELTGISPRLECHGVTDRDRAIVEVFNSGSKGVFQAQVVSIDGAEEKPGERTKWLMPWERGGAQDSVYIPHNGTHSIHVGSFHAGNYSQFPGMDHWTLFESSYGPRSRSFNRGTSPPRMLVGVRIFRELPPGHIDIVVELGINQSGNGPTCRVVGED